MTRTVEKATGLLTMDEFRQLGAISPRQTAHLLSMGKNACYAAIQRGEIPSLRIGAKIVIPVPALLAMLEPRP